MTPEQKRAAVRKQKRKREREAEVNAFLKKINVVSDEEAEQADMVICLPDDGPRYFTDDVTSVCAECGIVIRHRPHVPKRPKKVCIHCALRMLEQENASRPGS